AARRHLSELALPLSVAVVSLVLLSRTYVRSLDSAAFDWVFLGLFSVVTALVVTTMHGQWMAWRLTRRLLQLFARHPAAKAFARIPDLLGATSVAAFFTALPRMVDLVPLARELSALKVTAPGGGDLCAQVEEEVSRSFGEEGDSVAWGAAELCWKLGAAEVRAELEKGSPTGARAPAEDVFALRAMLGISWLIAQLRGMVPFVVLGPVLMILGVGSYPFQSQRMFLLFIGALMVVGVTVTLVILVQLDRDHVVSLIMGTKSGHINWTLGSLGQLLGVVGVPLLAYLAVQFPEIGDWLGGVLGPVLRTIK
ncbi:MAG TPA: hypothetical protein VND93_15575, partial [Myxococcales bacterium]|nr:hypothetical protein [Myxococcales bacterium]